MMKKYSALMPWLVWFLGALFYFYENTLQVSTGVLVDELMRDFSVSAAALGNMSAFFFYVYAPMQIPVGVLVDRFSVKLMLILAAFSCALGAFIFGASINLAAASVGRALMGFGAAFAAVCTMKLAANWFSPLKFPLLVGLMVTIGFSGSMVGEQPLAHCIDLIGWRQCMYVLSALGCVLIILISSFVRSKPQQAVAAAVSESSAAEQQKRGLLKGLLHVLKNPQSWIIAIYGCLMFASTSIFGGLWGVPFIQKAYSLTKPEAAGLVSLLFLGWVIGSPLTGWLASLANTRKQVMWIGSVLAFVTMVLIIYLPMSQLLLSVCIFTFGVGSSCFLPSFSFIKELHPIYYSGAALGFMNMANMIGGALGQPFVGWLLDISWKGQYAGQTKIYSLQDYQLALMTLPLILGTSLLLLYFIKEKPLSELKESFA